MRHAASAVDGTYRILGLTPGLYDAGVRAVGYRQQRHEGIALTVGQHVTLSFTLEPGPVELEPIVVAGLPGFEVQRTDVSTVVSAEEVARLPLNSRSVLNLAAIAPGVRSYAAEAGRSVPLSGSMPSRLPGFSNFYLDGVEWKNVYVGQVAGVPETGSLIPQEAVREFRVFLNAYDPEYARGATNIMSVVTHRGSRVLEGSIFGFAQNQSLVAHSAFQASEPDYRRYQIGANLRGPLVRNRLFFSASYEGQLTDNYVDVVPGRPPEDPAIWDQYAGTFPAPHRLHTGLLRLTAPLNRHTLDAIWATRHLRTQSNFGTRLQGRMLAYESALDGVTTVNSLLIRDTYASASLVNELSIHGLDFRNDQLPLVPGPTLQYPGIQIGRNNFPFKVHDRQFRVIDKLTHAVHGAGGRHHLGAGLEVSRVSSTVYRPFDVNGRFMFARDTSTNPLTGIIGVGRTDPGSTREAEATITGWLVGVYLQDRWQPAPALTVTAGVRYDAELNTLNQDVVTPWAADARLDSALGGQFLNTGDRGTDLDNLAPRLAISWDALGTGRTFLRAGYGVMYDRVPLLPAMNERINIGWRVYAFPNPGTTDPDSLRRRVAAGDTTTPPGITLIKDRLQTPANHQWSVGVGHRFSPRLAVNLDYINQRVRNVYVTVKANLRTPGSPARPIGGYGDITIWDDLGDATFEALLASITYDRPPTRLNVAYTLGWAHSEFGDFTFSDYPTGDAYAMQRSEGDERHRLVVSGFTSLPLGFTASGMVIAATPRPVLATIGADSNQNGSDLDDWPGGTRTMRQTGWAHWYRTVDVRLERSFPLHRGSLAVMAEVFNLFSWRNHSEYQATQLLTGYGEPVGDYARRQAQLGVRYQF